ncbi:MAG: hypothetical protein SFX73_10880 [Kofleriaceae bacterium]|nr:hypothetical protein [Kofleriaceae bacterium]
MGHGRAIALVLLAACGGHEPSVADPGTRARVRVVRCAPATPPPMITSAGLRVDPLGTARELARFRLRGHAAREAVAMAKPVDIESVVIVSGAQDRSALLTEMRRSSSAFERCLETHKAVQTVPATLTMAFSIDPDGALSMVTTTGTATTEVRSCFTEAARAQRFSPSGGTARVSVRVKLDPSALVARTPEEEASPKTSEPWTPYAIEVAEALASTPQIARSMELALRERGPTFARCFASSRATGSLRALAEVDAHGRVVATRVGGIGDRALETCIAAAFTNLTVSTPTTDAVEIACDLSRGDAMPWRVTPDAGYQLVEVTRTQVRYGDDALAPTDVEPEPLPGGVTYLVVVDPDAPGALIDRALGWTHEGDGTLIAMRVPSGPPVLLGAGRSIYAVADEGSGSARTITVVVGSKAVTTCERTPRRLGVTTTTQDAPLADPRAVSLLIGELAASCRQRECTGTLGIAVDKAAAARDLVEVVSAARRHGFDRVMLGAGNCTTPAEPDE